MKKYSSFEFVPQSVDIDCLVGLLLNLVMLSQDDLGPFCTRLWINLSYFEQHGLIWKVEGLSEAFACLVCKVEVSVKLDRILETEKYIITSVA